MNQRQLETLSKFRKWTGIGLFLGLVIFASSFLVSGIKGDYILSIGLSVMVSSMLLFGFGMFFNLMDEYTDREFNIKSLK